MSELLTIVKREQINFGSRVREQYEDLEGLAASIREVGLIQPLILRITPDNKLELAAGGRRWKATELLGIEEFHYGLTCRPGMAGFLFESDLSETDRMVIELEENLHREDLTWKETVTQIVKIHRLKTKQAALSEIPTTWGQRQTGALLGVSLGTVSNAVRVVEAIEKGNESVAKADSLTAALQVLFDQKEKEGLAKLAQMSKIPIGVKPTLKVGELLGEANWLETGEKPASGSMIEQDGKPAPAPFDDIEVPLSKMLYHGDSVRDLLPNQWPAETFDHIYTDIPYGIDPENMIDLKNFEKVEEAHQVIENIELMQAFLPEAFRVLKTGGYLIFWCDIEHWEKLMKWGTATSFKVQRWPLYWDKLHPCRNQAPQYNWTKSVETAMVMRKGNAVLIKPQNRNIFSCDGAIERKMYNNPFAKPFELHKWVLEAVAITGQSILDPFAGGGSIPRAAANMGLRPVAMEKDEAQFNHLVEHMKSAYKAITHGKVKFV